jgi:hypothetical protein
MFMEKQKRFLGFYIAGSTLRSERGVSLVVVIMLMVVILAITGAGLLFSSVDLRVSTNYRAGTQAFYAADAGVSDGFARVGPSIATSTAAFTGTVGGITYCSGTVTTATSCTPQPLVALDPIPATGCSLGRGLQVNAGNCYLQPYQIDTVAVQAGSVGSVRQIQAVATWGPMIIN